MLFDDSGLLSSDGIGEGRVDAGCMECGVRQELFVIVEETPLLCSQLA